LRSQNIPGTEQKPRKPPGYVVAWSSGDVDTVVLEDVDAGAGTVEVEVDGSVVVVARVVEVVEGIETADSSDCALEMIEDSTECSSL
jgi:hypothetical protein